MSEIKNCITCKRYGECPHQYGEDVGECQNTADGKVIYTLWEKKEQPRTRFDEFKENLTLEQLASILSKDEENCKPCPVYEYCRKTTGLWCHEIVLLWCNELVEDGE